MAERTSVYRLYGADDQLLYVGIAKRFGSRWEQHAKEQPWWDQVDHQTVNWFASREDALLAEKRAIHEEMPVYNKRDSPWEAVAKDDGTGFYVIPKVRATSKSRSGNRHKHQLTAWHSSIPGLAEWIRAEAEHRGQSVREFLDHVVSEYRRTHSTPDTPDHEGEQNR